MQILNEKNNKQIEKTTLTIHEGDTYRRTLYTDGSVEWKPISFDGDKLNNHVDNLEWCNNSYNQKHAIENGLKIIKSGKESSRFNGEIFVYNKQNELVDILYGNKDMKEKGYDFRNVSAVVTGKRKTYKNLIFKKQ